MQNIETVIEAILFYKNEPVKLNELCRILSADREKVEEAVKNLANNLEHRGINLIENGDVYSLATAKDAAPFIEKIAQEEISIELSKASLETLAIVLYCGPISRREIDYIRGVNSAFILRSLMMRGLVEREEREGRLYLYKPALELLAKLGLNSVSKLPDYEIVKKEIERIKTNDAENTE